MLSISRTFCIGILAINMELPYVSGVGWHADSKSCLPYKWYRLLNLFCLSVSNFILKATRCSNSLVYVYLEQRIYI